ncbi:MAG: GNAT family N-acetyltransferase [Spirochaetales bacterium]|nr:MAG: GNAT family N-acetyltransferase [Spirochaetales bacterium]
MAWTILKKSDQDRLLDFLLPREAFCTSLTAYLKRELARPGFFRDTVILAASRDSTGHLSGVLVLMRGGHLFPVFESDYNPDAEDLQEIQAGISKTGKKIFLVMGLNRDVRIAEGIFSQTPHTIDYYTYCISGNLRDIPSPDSGKLSVHLASGWIQSGRMARLLHPLQEGYEKEEVLLSPDRFNRTASLTHFRKQLESQIIYYAVYDGIPVSKAGTNAMGYEYIQLGGVYTLQDFRSRGIASFVVHTLTEDLLAKGMKITLFVKHQNLAALTLYEKMGFERKGDFRISYYL